MPEYDRLSEKSVMRKSFSLAMVIMVMVLLGLLGTYVMTSVNSSLFSASEVSVSENAFYIAEAGLNWVLEKYVLPCVDYTTLTAPSSQQIGQGSFSVSYANQTENSLDITVTGMIIRGGTEYERAVSMYLKKASSPGSVEHVQYVGGNISLNNTHDNSVIIIGDITGGGDVDLDDSVDQEGETEKNTGEQPPDFDFEYYSNRIKAMRDSNDPRYLSGQVQYIEGDKVITGDYGSETEGEGALWYVTGNVSLFKGVNFKGSIISEGDVTGWNGQVVVKAVKFDIDGEDGFDRMPALALKGSLDLHNASPVIIYGLIYVEGDIDINNIQEDFDIVGAIVCGGNMDIKNVKCDSYFEYDDTVLPDLASGEEGSPGEEGEAEFSWQEVNSP